MARKATSLAAGLVAVATVAIAGPCDLYGSGGTPCVAAHSTTRALYEAYDGPLYQVTRSSDSTTSDIAPVSPGGVANSGAQDSFCSGTDCTITTIYDQSGNGNNLTPAPPGGAASGSGPNGFDLPANATAAPIYLGSSKVYGVYIDPGMGYRNDATKGIATGDDPEGIYAVLDGSHYNAPCCFDYGNAELNATDNGAGHMEAIYFGNGANYDTGAGSGPWIMADLENGLFSTSTPTTQNTNDPSQTSRFVTAIVKGNSGNSWAIRGGDATSGQLGDYFNGPRPDGYNPMQKEGAIILGIGGDNSNGAEGTFYEGAMTSGYPSDDTENSVAQDIQQAQYSTGPSGY